MNFIQVIRSIAFDIAFYIGTGLFVALLTPFVFFSEKFTFKLVQIWSHGFFWCCSNILGLSYKLEGLENLPDGACIIASKHQSVWETFIFNHILNHPSMVYKKELSYIPFFGQFLKYVGSTLVDRSAGIKAIKMLNEQAKRVIDQGRKVVIFPEGTRGIAGQPGVYQPGLAAMYTELDVPVIPCTVNSGLFWGRRSTFKKAGLITLKFLPPILPGIKRKEFTKQFEEKLESASMKLYQETANETN